MTITTSFSDGFKPLFEEIKAIRPDLNNNSEIAQEAIRYYAQLVKQQKSIVAQKEEQPILRSFIEFMIPLGEMMLNNPKSNLTKKQREVIAKSLEHQKEFLKKQNLNKIGQAPQQDAPVV